jgi:hypothetical protein
MENNKAKSSIAVEFTPKFIWGDYYGKAQACENNRCGGQNCCHIIFFFKGTMFEFQPCYYCEGFSQCFCILWCVKTQINQMPKKTTFKNFIWCDVIIYLHKKNVHHNVFKNENILKKWYIYKIKFVVFTKHCNRVWKLSYHKWVLLKVMIINMW